MVVDEDMAWLVRQVLFTLDHQIHMLEHLVHLAVTDILDLLAVGRSRGLGNAFIKLLLFQIILIFPILSDQNVPTDRGKACFQCILALHHLIKDRKAQRCRLGSAQQGMHHVQF